MASVFMQTYDVLLVRDFMKKIGKLFNFLVSKFELILYTSFGHYLLKLQLCADETGVGDSFYRFFFT